MTRSIPAADGATILWHDLVPDHPDLVYTMAQRLEFVGSLPRVERERAVASLLDYEAGLSEPDLRTILVAELRSLAAIPAEAAENVQRAIDTFVKARPATFSMRRAVAMQRASRDLSLDELRKLEPLIEGIRVHAGLAPARPSAAGMEAGARGSSRPRRSVLSRLFSRP